ncbi:MAG: hypothetical protein AUI10_07165 [Actinobacteria bacterium 13_2_20CM_2_72_6]|nr:MAG: hypothetical protein AUI10_07165 [Actinobacteria bacterium 13_2_20CM_2_72_6]
MTADATALRHPPTGAATTVELPAVGTAWLLTRYRDVYTALGDPRLRVRAPEPPGRPRLGPVCAGSATGLATDPAERLRIRRWAESEFSQDRAESLRPAIQRLADQVLEDADAEPPDRLADTFAAALAGYTLCRLVGVPPADYGYVCALAEGWLVSAGPDADAEEADATGELLYGYLAELLETRLSRPADDLLSNLAATRRPTGRSWETELVTLALIVFTAGYQLSRTTIGHAVATLLDHPEQGALLRRSPELLRYAVEELLRWQPAAPGGELMLVAGLDLDVGGVSVREGDTVLASIAAANRDPAVFTDGHRLDVTRRYNPHLTFGLGAHQCLGADLARVELSVAVQTIVWRLAP